MSSQPTLKVIRTTQTYRIKGIPPRIFSYFEVHHNESNGRPLAVATTREDIRLVAEEKWPGQVDYSGVT